MLRGSHGIWISFCRTPGFRAGILQGSEAGPQKPTLTVYAFMRRSWNEGGGAEAEREEETPASILILDQVTRHLFNGLLKSSILGYCSIHLVFTLGEKHSFGGFHSKSGFNLDPVSAKRWQHWSGGG